MSQTAAELMHAFSTLPPHERRAVLIEIVGISESDDGPLTDDKLTFAGETTAPLATFGVATARGRTKSDVYENDFIDWH